jgi:hypothetical protein
MSEPLKLWSVTTLLKLGLGTSDALVNWAVRTTAEAAVDRRTVLDAMLKDGDRDGAVKWLADQRWAKSGAALARGTDIHRAAEARALGEPVEVEVQNLPLLEQYDRFLSEFQPEFLMAEAPCYHPKAGYAGTLDSIAIIDGQRVVLDIKTTDKGKDSTKMRPPYPETALQLAAYRHATEVGVLSEQRYAGGKRYYLYDESAKHEPMPEVDGAVCLVVSPDDYLVVPVRTDEQVFRYFRHVVECARWSVSESRGVFGAPLSKILGQSVEIVDVQA